MTHGVTLTSHGDSFNVVRKQSGVYEVFVGSVLIGFVERAGNVYVALTGARYDRAEEAGQALTLARAAQLLNVRRPSKQLVYS